MSGTVATVTIEDISSDPPSGSSSSNEQQALPQGLSTTPLIVPSKHETMPAASPEPMTLTGMLSSIISPILKPPSFLRSHQHLPVSSYHQLTTTSPTSKSIVQFEKPVEEWTVTDVQNWTRSLDDNCNCDILTCIEKEEIDGKTLLTFTEDDIYNFRYHLNYNVTYAELKRYWIAISQLQEREWALNGFVGHKHNAYLVCHRCTHAHPEAFMTPLLYADTVGQQNAEEDEEDDTISPEVFKTFISFMYAFAVTWITSFVMVIVHERVPDMQRYPPLPDIFLDNIPYIPWAFHMCEFTATALFMLWTLVIIFHRHRIILLRRFFALSGSIFLLRCVTMLITSLSVPDTHLKCEQIIFEVSSSFFQVFFSRIKRAYCIWSGLGMSVKGIRTCGDYMFSGHTVALTLLNFFITEYTPFYLYYLHTLTWLLNMFGIFFVLAAHEHYSIDVFVAFYITSRMFLYYHSLANNRMLIIRDIRARIWFPLFIYFENSVTGIVPNEYDSIEDLIGYAYAWILYIKDLIVTTSYNYFVERKDFRYPKISFSRYVKLRTVGTNMYPSDLSTNTFANGKQSRAAVKYMQREECDCEDNGNVQKSLPPLMSVESKSPKTLLAGSSSSRISLEDSWKSVVTIDDSTTTSSIIKKYSPERVPATDHHRL